MKKATVISVALVICWVFLGGRVVYGFDTIDHPDSLLSISDAKAFFDSLHVESENWYMGASPDSGTWENHYQMGYQTTEDSIKPWIPSTGRRVIAYIQASHVDGNNRDTYLNRAYEGLQYLLSEQKSDGRFERELSEDGDNQDDSSESTLDEVYDTALGGVALVAGYREFGTTAYRDSAKAAADWTIQGGALEDSIYCDPTDSNWSTESPLEAVSFFANANYVAFIAWLLASVYEETGTSTYIDHAVTACDSIMDWQLGDGTWYHYLGSSPDYDKHMVYHCITLRGLLETYWAIKGDPDYASFQTELEGSITDAINYMIDQQKSAQDKKLREWKDGTLTWIAGLEALSMAHDYLDDGSDLNGLIFALARHTRSYNYQGSGNNPVYKAAEARHHDILNFGWYLHSTIWGKIYPGEVWSGTIRPTGDVIVSSGDSLKIEPGTTVKFAVNKDSYHGPQYTSKCELIVHGKLTAEGTSPNRITLESTEGGTTRNQWRGIEFRSSADDASVVEYCNIKNASRGIHCDYASPALEYNTITYSSVGIKGVSMGSSGSISHNTIHNTVTGIALYSNSTVPVMYNNLSSNSRSFHADGSTPTVQHNTMNSNSNDGMWLFNNADVTLGNNQIVGNAGWGMWLWDGTDPVLQGSGAHNNIHDNGNNEIYCQKNCVPLLGDSALGLPGHNDIYDDTGYAIFILHTEPYSNLTAEYNWWGSANPNANTLFWPHDAVDYQPYDTISNFGAGKVVAGAAKAVAPLQDAQDVARGLTLEEEKDYSRAIEVYKALLKRTAEGQYARVALGGLHRCYMATGEGFSDFRALLLDFVERCQDAGTRVKAQELARHALVAEGRYAQALGEYQGIVDAGGDEALIAMLKTGEIYLHRLKEREKAKAVLEQVVQKTPEDSPEGLAARMLLEDLEAMPGLEPSEPEPRVTEKSSSQEEVDLLTSYPNPFNPQTLITFTLPKPAFVSLEAYNILGQRVKILAKGFQQAGIHSVTWDGRDENGKELASGIYLYRLVVDKGRFVQTKKMLLIR